MKAYRFPVLPALVAISLGAIGQADAATLNLQGATLSGQIDSAEGLRFGGVVADAGFGTLDLVVIATDGTDPYDAANTNNNGIAGEFGQINLRNNTTTSFQFRIVEAGGTLDDIVTPDELTISFLDLDGGGSANNSIFESITVATPSTALSGSGVAVDTSVAGQTSFAATLRAGARNNPSTSLLTLEQSQIAVELTFENKGVLDFTFSSGAGNPNSGRNIFFGGEVTFDDSVELTRTQTSGIPEGGVVPGVALAGVFLGGLKLRQRRHRQLG